MMHAYIMHIRIIEIEYKYCPFCTMDTLNALSFPSIIGPLLHMVYVIFRTGLKLTCVKKT